MKQELLYWTRKWELEDNLLFKESSQRQAHFVRKKICGNLLKAKGFVVSTHHSKSCELPVYYIKMRNGIKVIMRCNFYDWKVSVEIPAEYDSLPADYLPMDCMSHSMVQNDFEKIPSCYCEGFKEEWCYNAYNPQQPLKKFTIEIPDNECLYVILNYLKHAYPDIVFRVEDDKRTVDEIEHALDKIFEENGFNDLYEDNKFGTVRKRHVMSAWEIIWRTYIKLDSPKTEFPAVSDKSRDYAEGIIKYPDVHAEFLMEEWMFKEYD